MKTESGLYGRSLYELAAEEHLEEEILKEMETVRGLFQENPEYLVLLSEPSVPKKDRLKLLDEAFGEDMQAYLLNFLKLLLEKGMLRSFGTCFRVYREAYNAAHNIAEGTVTSAVALTEEQLEKLKSRLETMSGKTVLLRTRTDPQVLGGLRVELEGKLFDGTVQGRLTALRKKVSEVVI